MLDTMMSAMRPRNRVELACAVLAPPGYALIKGAMALMPTKTTAPAPIAGKVIELGAPIGSAAD